MDQNGAASGPGEASLLERLPLAPDRPWIGYAAAAGGAVLAAAIRLLFPASGGFPFITFIPTVVVVAFLFGVRPGLLAAFVSALLALWFFLPHAQEAGAGSAFGIALFFYLLAVGLIISLIHWMQSAHAALSRERQVSAALAANRELLFRELQHRVSNNLQVVAALLALHRKDTDDPRAQAALDDASRRLGLIGRIHRQLYEPGGNRIGMTDFLNRLAVDVIETAGRTSTSLSVEVEDEIDLKPDAAIPVALIASEAIANAVEHGLAGRESGMIRVAMSRAEGGGVLLEVSDDGVGLPPGFDADRSLSLGLRIAATLARQLGGRFEMAQAGGAVARLRLPAKVAG